MTTPAGMENRVIKRLTCSWEMFSSDRISGRTGISMELPRTMSRGMMLKVRRTTQKAAALLLSLLGLKQGRHLAPSVVLLFRVTKTAFRIRGIREGSCGDNNGEAE